MAELTATTRSEAIDQPFDDGVVPPRIQPHLPAMVTAVQA
jgi:hypothetical protein